jgi:hypothetical protein
VAENGLASSLKSTTGAKKASDTARFEQLLQEEQLLSELDEERAVDSDAMLWSTERVRKWLVQVGLEDLYGTPSFAPHGFFTRCSPPRRLRTI